MSPAADWILGCSEAGRVAPVQPQRLGNVGTATSSGASNPQTTAARLWAGAGLAVALWAPNLAWQAVNGWPTAAFDANLRAEHSGLGNALAFPFVMLLVLGLAVALVWTSGWWALGRDPSMRPWRAFAVAFGFGFAALWVVIPGRFYYLFGIFPVLIAAGALVTDDVLDGARGFFRPGPSRRLLWRSRWWAIGLVLVAGVTALPLALPVLPPGAVATLGLEKANYNLGEEIGWQDLTGQVAAVWRSLTPAERRAAVIVTDNYGEAGAIDRYGAALGLPRAYSGHNSYWWWGPPRPSVGTTVAIGLDRDELSPYFDRCTLAAHVRNRDGVDNEERGRPILVCAGQRVPWPRIWDEFRHYS